MNLAELVAQVLEELEPDEREAISGVQIRVRPRPLLLDLARGCTSRQLGCFWGVAWERPQQGASTALPDTTPATGEVVLFLENIRRMSGAFVWNVRQVLEHELLHALGHDEDTIRHVYGLELEEDACTR